MKVGVLFAIMLVFALVISTPEVVEAGPAPPKGNKKPAADEKGKIWFFFII